MGKGSCGKRVSKGVLRPQNCLHCSKPRHYITLTPLLFYTSTCPWPWSLRARILKHLFSLKILSLAWKIQTRLTNSVSLEKFNLDFQNSPRKKTPPGVNGERGGRIREKGGRNAAPEAHLTNSDFGVPLWFRYLAATATHHPHKSDDQHRECRIGGGAYFAFSLGSDKTELPPKHFKFDTKSGLKNAKKDPKNDPKHDRKSFSPSQAALKYFTGTFLKVFHLPKFAQKSFSPRGSAG